MEFNGDDFQLGDPKVRAAIEAFEEYIEEGAEEELQFHSGISPPTRSWVPFLAFSPSKACGTCVSATTRIP